MSYRDFITICLAIAIVPWLFVRPPVRFELRPVPAPPPRLGFGLRPIVRRPSPAPSAATWRSIIALMEQHRRSFP